MTKLLSGGLLAILLLSGFSTRALAQEAPLASLDVWEHPPRTDDHPLDDTERRLRRYKRMRIAGGALIGMSVASIGVSTAVAAAHYDCDPNEEWFCGLSSPGFMAAAVTGLVSPALVAGGITLGTGVRRDRRLRLESPQLAASRHGFGVSLLGRF